MAGSEPDKGSAKAAQPAIILVAPQMGENIGAAARAMLNFGLTDMRIVAPRDGWPNAAAQAMASGADAVLAAARIFETAAAAVADLDLVYATTARERDMSKPALTPREMAGQGAVAAAEGRRPGILFGGERMGLSNDDVVLARAIIHVPANPAFSSLNLAQAVLLCAYEWRLAAAPVQTAQTALPDLDERRAPAPVAQMTSFLNFLTEELDSSGFFDVVADKRPTMLRNIRALFHRAGLRGHEVQTLFGIVRSLSGHRQGRSGGGRDGG